MLLELEDKFTREIAVAAAGAADLKRQLDALNGTQVSTKTSTDGLGDSTEKATRKTKEYNLSVALAEQTTARFKKQLRDQANAMLDATQKTDLAADAVQGFGNNTDSSGRQIDRLSGRLALLARAAAVLGPALVPLGAATVPAIAGLATQMGALAGAVGVGALAFSGLGDSLGALNDFQLDPTAENLEALQLQMEKIGPAGEQLTRFLDSIAPQFSALQMAAREGLFPGVEDGINNLLPLLPKVSSIITEIATAMGSLASDAGASLAGPQWAGFFDYLENEAAPILVEFGKTVGNFAQGFANLLVGLSPAASDFSGGLLEMSRSFAEWSRSLESNQGFQSFLDYVREAGPKAVDFLGSLVEAIAGIAQAAAPVGDVVLPILTAMLDLIGNLASSPLGAVLVGLAASASAISGAMGLAQLATAKFVATADLLAGTSARGSAAMTGLARAGAALAVLSVAGVAIDGVRDAAIGAAPAVENLTASLIDANGQAFNAEFGGSIKQALDSLDPGVIDTIANSLNGLGDKAGIAGPAVDGAVNTLGALVGFSQPLNDTAIVSGKVAEAFGSLDSALAGLVANGGADRAREAFSELAASQGLSRDQTKALLSQLPEYEAALTGAANGASLAAEEQANAAMTADEFKAAVQRNAQANNEAAVAYQALREAASETASSFFDFSAGADDANRSLSEFIASMADQAAALRDFTMNAVTAGERGVKEGLINQLRELGPAGAQAMRQLANASDEEIARANRAYAGGRQAIKNYADSISGVPELNLKVQDAEGRARIQRIQGLLDKFGMTKAEATAFLKDAASDKTKAVQRLIDQYGVSKGEATALLRDLASGAISNVAAKLRALNGDTATTYINTIATTTVRRVETSSGGGYEPGVPRAADGTFVPKTGLPYRDRHPYLLADGEGVTTNRNGETDRFRDVVSGINAGYSRQQIKGMLAGGGFADSRMTPGPQSWGNFDAATWADRQLREFGGTAAWAAAGLKDEREARVKLLTSEQEATKERISNLRAEAEAIRSSVAARLESDIFARGEQREAYVVPPPDYSGMTPAEAQAASAAYRAEVIRQQGIDDQINASQTRSPEDRIRADIAEARLLARQVSQLEAKGLGPDALKALLDGGDDAQIAAYASGSARDVRTLDRLFDQRSAVISQTSQSAVVASGLAAALREARVDAKETNLRLAAVERELKISNRQGAEAPEKTGQAVGQVIKGEVVKGQKNRRLS